MHTFRDKADVGAVDRLRRFMGGLNYCFTNLTNGLPGSSMREKVGYQFGASCALISSVAIEGTYHGRELETTNAAG